MPRDDRSAIHDAYRRTSYRAAIDGQRVEMRAGELSPELDVCLAAHGERQWAFVTAANPHARPQTERENAARHAELARALDAAGLARFDGESVGDAGDWPAERSLLVLGISELEALELARRFGQEAIVVGERSQPAQLVFCAEDA